MEACELTILMPSLNEAETLASCIQKAKTFLEKENIRGEILIADNGSTDGSQDIAKAHGVRVISVATRGYGAALKSGIQAAVGRYVIMGDADDSYDFLNLKPFITKLREGYDLVMGNRFKGGIKEGAMPFLNRYLGNPVLSFFGRVFFKSHIGDFHCGLRGFDRQKFLQLNLQGDGMEFASEMVVKASLNQLQITEVPTVLSKDGRSRRPHLRPWRDGWRHLRLLLLFSPRWLFFYPGIFLLSLGSILMLVLAFGPIALGSAVLDIHTMLFAEMFMIVGVQALCFASFSRASPLTPIPQAVEGRLEMGILISLMLMLVGFAGACYGFWLWRAHTFGPLVPTQMMRLLIPSTTAIMLGMQLLFASFFKSMLNLNDKAGYTN